jgi:hypothetical protein
MSKIKSDDELYKLVNKDGAHLASSKKTNGAFRGILFDDKSNKLVAHAEWVKVDNDEYEDHYIYEINDFKKEELTPEEEELIQVLSEALATITIHVIEEVIAPRVKSWWFDNAKPFIDGKWSNIKTKGKNRNLKKQNNKLQANEIADLINGIPKLYSQQFDNIYNDYQIDMTSEKVQKEFVDIFILSVMLMSKINKLSHVNIVNSKEGERQFVEGQALVEKISSPEYVKCINNILENNQSLLEENGENISSYLNHNFINGGDFIPISKNELKEKLTFYS